MNNKLIYQIINISYISVRTKQLKYNKHKSNYKTRIIYYSRGFIVL
jgi:hypothetical protein